ncbi:sugar ABC transporter permease [Enterococcus faecium]|nr:sugar ABC transporter permease [Enterococcus faecium]RAQ32260.1 sugar ABC transporter permease [Enterococcus faecium]HAZ0855523.1 sugar ABC transporter permease [Enterococcus faecium]HAZ0870018.1 sugar ABC transporter permease [Enterococcus faecium]HAZ0878579.1 sugar ABC transporter permease [Enterococcus faecium]
MKQKDLFKNGHAFLILPVILISIMVFIPMVLALITSFQSGPPVNMTFNGLGNYQRMLTDATFKKAFFNRIRQKSPILYRWVMNAVRYEGYRW